MEVIIKGGRGYGKMYEALNELIKENEKLKNKTKDEECIYEVTKSQIHNMQNGHNITVMANCKMMLVLGVNLEFVYCPYCGRKIRYQNEE